MNIYIYTSFYIFGKIHKKLVTLVSPGKGNLSFSLVLQKK